VSDPAPGYFAPQPAGSPIKTALAAGAIVALIASNVYLYLQLDRTRTDVAKLRESLVTELTNLRETSSVSSANQRRRLEALQEELEAARKQASVGSAQARADAVARAEALAKRLADEQARQHQQVTSQLSEVKDVATTATTKIGQVSGEVTTVKTDVANTKSELDRTIADLKRVTGDLGVTSGLVATNGKELAALRRLGERNYFEFKIAKSKQPQRVGDVGVILKKTDTKRNKFTIELLADDKKTEKKDKTINEPVQFYTSKARQPYELVVNQVGKNLIVGYLATPKEQLAR